jgi:hypothetical protein
MQDTPGEISHQFIAHFESHHYIGLTEFFNPQSKYPIKRNAFFKYARGIQQRLGRNLSR